MKSIRSILLVTGLVLTISVSGQTNTFPASGKVGIGTTTPQYGLSFGNPSDKIGWYSDATHYNNIEFYNSSTGGMVFDQNTASGGGYIWSSAGSPLVTFQLNGNVGIGTTSPGDKLHVAGNVLIEGYNAFIARYNTGDSYRGHLSWDHVQLGNNGNNYIIAGNTVAGGALGFVVNNTNDLTGLYADINKNGTVAMQITSSGSVGIGTTSPSSKLDVVGQGQFSVDGVGADTAAYGVLGVTRAASASTLSYIAMTRSGNAVKAMGIDANNRWIFGIPTAWSQTITTPQMVIEQSGNVGIGTTNPTQKLSVNGTIRAKEVIVDTGWADYVFNESYRLAPLSEIEAHIKANKHLPGIPSAAEIAEHGVSMGDMQAKLLAKIEELTLHQIAQEKEVISLKSENAALRTDNTRVDLRLSRLEGR